MHDTDLVADGLVRISNAANFLSVSRSKIYQLMDSGELPYVLIGRCRRLPLRAIHDLAFTNMVGRPEK